MDSTETTTPGQTRPLVDVTQFDEVGEAWKCPHLSADLSGPGEHLFHEGTVMRLDGQEHLRRRRAVGLLLKRRGHAYFRSTWLFPTADAALADLLSRPSADGYAHAEILTWARRVNQQLAAAIVGFDDATSPAGADELFGYVQTIMKGRPGAFRVTMGDFDETAPEVLAAVEARDTIVERFYEGAMLRRRELARRLEAGAITEDDLPQDLLMLIARHLDPAWDDEALAHREALFLLAAGVHTTSSSFVWTLRELFAHLEEHPEDRSRLQDENFILRAAHEALRLHPVVPGFPRLATHDVALQHGTTVPEDAIAVIRSGPASMDPTVYGEDAETFNPDRAVPAGVYPHGFAFGTGPHMCYGMPIVMGTEGLDGSLVYLLKIVLDAGIEPDPDYPPMPLESTRGVFTESRTSSELRVRFPASV